MTATIARWKAAMSVWRAKAHLFLNRSYRKIGYFITGVVGKLGMKMLLWSNHWRYTHASFPVSFDEMESRYDRPLEPRR